jgi:hypothetical protein
MQLVDLLPLGPSSESTKELAALRVWLASAVVLARTQLGPDTDRQPLLAHFAQLPPADALRMSASLPSDATGSFLARLEELRWAQGARDGDPASIHNGLLALQRQIDAIVRRRRWLSYGISAAKVAAWAGPIVLAYLIGTYFRFYNNLYWDSEVIASPPATYTLRSGAHQIDEDHKARFYAEFSRYYFDRENHFVEQFVQGRHAVLTSDARSGAGSRGEDLTGRSLPSDVALNLGALVLRAVFRNPRRADPLLVSSIETTAVYHQRPFDWSRVDVRSDLDVRLVADYAAVGAIKLMDKGIGPAMKVGYRVSAGDMLLYSLTFDYLLNRTELMPLTLANGDVASLETGRDNRLVSSIYWTLGGPDPTRAYPTTEPYDGGRIAGTLLTCSDGRTYEIVKEVGRLGQLTHTLQGGPAKADIVFESLRGERAVKAVDVTLPANYVFARDADKIETRNPCLPPPPAPPPPPGPPRIARFLDSASGQQPQLKGVDLIKVRTSLDMRDVPDGGVVGTSVLPDEILNPGGFVAFDLLVGNARNGELALRFDLNGTTVRETRVELLVPDDAKFLPVADGKLAHFRKPGK